MVTLKGRFVRSGFLIKGPDLDFRDTGAAKVFFGLSPEFSTL